MQETGERMFGSGEYVAQGLLVRWLSGKNEKCAQVFPVPSLGLDLQQAEPCPPGRERESGSSLAAWTPHPSQSHYTSGYPTWSQCLPQQRERLPGSLGLFPFITQPRATVRSPFPAWSVVRSDV